MSGADRSQRTVEEGPGGDPPGGYLTGSWADAVVDGVPSTRIEDLVPFARERLSEHAPVAAELLLGALIVRRWGRGEPTVARIVETEAYRETDPASHSARGRTPRNAAMFGEPGTAYVYRSYGIHWCMNVTVEPPGTGAAALVRAAVVLSGASAARARRATARVDAALLRGPGNLAAGLALRGDRHDGIDLTMEDGEVMLADDGWRPPAERVARGPRVGITQASETPWRFSVVGSAAVSAYRRSPRAAVPKDVR